MLPTSPPPAAVSVVVIAYNDAEHVAQAVQSALRQGPVVAEVIAVDDASCDGTGKVLDRLAAQEQRVRVVHRSCNSGGCGTPRNLGLEQVTAPWVMFLDSDDELADGAVERLLAAARAHSADVAAGACLRRELPDGREVRWQPQLFGEEVCHMDTAKHSELLWDTLSVNKLYARDFLDRTGVRFPEGAFPYEDFVFTARLYAASACLAVVPDPVYIWQVRRHARRLSISLDRARIENWHGRLAAQQLAVRTLEEAGRGALADAARVRFLDHDLRLYLRELPHRSPAYREAWWRHACAALRSDRRTARVVPLCPPQTRWVTRALLAGTVPPPAQEIERLAALAARPGRLLPPYSRGAGGTPVWSAALPAKLDDIEAVDLEELPVALDAEVATGTRTRCTVTLHDLYGRLDAAVPESLELTMRHRTTGRVGRVAHAPFTRARTGTPVAGAVRTSLTASAPRPCRSITWTATFDDLGLAGLAAGGAIAAWDVLATVHFRGGAVRQTTVRARGPGLTRTAVPHRRWLVVLLQPYATHDGSLAFRIAPGLHGVLRVVRARTERALRRGAGRRPRTPRTSEGSS